MSAQHEQSGPSPREEIFRKHEGGKLSVVSKAPLATRRDLPIAYSPAVADVNRAVAADHAMAASHTGPG